MRPCLPPSSGSPVAPSRTCRLFPRRDSRSPHLSSVHPLLSPFSSHLTRFPQPPPHLSPCPSYCFPLQPAQRVSAHVCRQNIVGHLFIFRYFWDLAYRYPFSIPQRPFRSSFFFLFFLVPLFKYVFTLR